MKATVVLVASVFVLGASLAYSGPLDPDCTVEKGVKGAAAKATLGVGGRCKPGEVAADSAKRAVGVDGDKKKKDGDGIVKKAGKKLVD